ncbi:hypothetical protein R6231_12485 [Bacillus cytotoxicus]|uniref:hypothetical protein n=1 Tax=Bacillus cytotoxicus TaxID=580165 RepID=UPI0008641CAF|nr:hypothetical protein [Bacillus cytotoxicus]SCN42993.1 Uncharacterized protein BC88300_04690 [Bacillus cytotoxicus]
MNLYPLILLFILVLLFVLVAYNLVLERQKSKRFQIYSIVKKSNVANKRQPILYTILYPILKLKKNWISQEREKELEKKLKKVNSSLTPMEFIISKLTFSIINFLVIASLIFYVPDLKIVIFPLALVFAVMGFYVKESKLNSNVKAKQLRMQLELPEYMISLAYMIGRYTAYEATKRSIEYASDNLRPLVENLIAQIELEPGNFEPYLEFAREVDIPAAYQFMVALQQAMVMDESQSREIINNQIKLMRRLRAESYETLVASRPDMVFKYLISTYLCIIVFVIGFSFTSIYEKFVHMF